VPIIAATLVAAINFIPFHFDVAGYTIGSAEIFLAGILLYYVSINAAFAVFFMLFRWEWLF
jgi:hypothetical protein